MVTKNIQQKGYTLLFAVLLTALVLSVGVSILTIARKEIILTANSRESHKAIVAADSGLECAVYWNRVVANFPSTLPDEDTSNKKTQINCHDTAITVSEDSPDLSSVVYSWSVDKNNSCARVELTKEVITLPTGDDIVVTTYESRGYNASCSQIGPRTVERALRYSI